MKKVLIMPVLATALFAAACGDSDPTAPDTRAQVRFFNAVWNATGSIGFTTNAQFAAGSAIGYGQSTQACTRLEDGNASFGIGLANAAGTALNGDALAKLNNETIAAGGNYTVLAGGNVLHPSVILLDNSFSGTLGTNQAAVRFVNLAAASQFPFTVLKGTVESGPTTVVQGDLAFRSATTFSSVASGSNAYTILYNHEVAISGNDATLNLQGGTVNTIAIIRNPSGDFQLINIPSCS